MERAPHTRPPTHRSARSLVAALGAIALVLAALGGPLAGAAAAKPKGTPPGASHAADPARTATVMTRNLYLGADLTPIITALGLNPPNPTAVIGAATQTWQQVVASDPEERMAAIADEIVAAKPHAVGLQEVTRWTTYDFTPPSGPLSNKQVAYDFLDLLLAELAARGVTYREVPGATAENFTSDPIPILDGAAFPTKAVQLLDRDVIIVRGGVKATNAHHGNFQTILGPALGFPIEVDRGWGSADLRTRLASFRFVNSHTEAFGQEEIRIGEVQELLAAQAAISAQSGALPTVYAGDYNSPATSAGAYQTLIGSGLHDLWTQARPGASASESATCCQDADLGNETSNLGTIDSTRIDLLLGTEGVRATSAHRVGDVPIDLPGDTWWASDHAGVVADVVIPRPRR